MILLVILLVSTLIMYPSGRFCAYLGTDFRGYFAAAQIARQIGFAAVYDMSIQEQYQAVLSFRCPDASYAPPLIRVSMPYLPVFVVVFLPLTYLDFTSAYYLWVILNMAALLVYLRHFTYALGERAGYIRALQWALCVPVFSNLALGQMNVYLVICLGEFVLASLIGRHSLGGFWLGGMLMKPHILILLLPGLIIRKNWQALLGFISSALAILLVSTLLAGWYGVWSSVRLAIQFSGPLIQTGPTMMNFRALALNLEPTLPAWLAWAVAICGIALVAGFTLYLWKRYFSALVVQFIILIVATLAGTFAATWHSHFYMLMLLLPLLLILDLKQIISPAWRWAWIMGPLVFFGLLYLANPDQVRNWFGLGMLAFNVFLLIWAAGILKHAGKEIPGAI